MTESRSANWPLVFWAYHLATLSFLFLVLASARARRNRTVTKPPRSRRRRSCAPERGRAVSRRTMSGVTRAPPLGIHSRARPVARARANSALRLRPRARASNDAFGSFRTRQKGQADSIHCGPRTVVFRHTANGVGLNGDGVKQTRHSHGLTTKCRAIYDHDTTPADAESSAAREQDGASTELADLFATSYARKLPRVIYEDEDILAVDKPTGMSVHPDGESSGIVATIQALQKFDQLPGSGYAGPLFPVHSLDAAVSGVLLLAKTEAAAEALALQFERRKVVSYFVALSDREPSKTAGTIIGQLSEGRGGVFKLVRIRETGFGRKGINEKDIVTKFASRPVFGIIPDTYLQLLVLKGVTDKANQMEATCNALNAPVLGDEPRWRQGDGKDNKYLHSAAIRIRLPPMPMRASSSSMPSDDEGEVAVEKDDSRLELPGRVIQIVCPPTRGAAWCAPAFCDAWKDIGFGGASHGMREWFPHDNSLRTSLDELLEAPVEEVLTVADGGGITVTYEKRNDGSVAQKAR